MSMDKLKSQLDKAKSGDKQYYFAFALGKKKEEHHLLLSAKKHKVAEVKKEAPGATKYCDGQCVYADNKYHFGIDSGATVTKDAIADCINAATKMSVKVVVCKLSELPSDEPPQDKQPKPVEDPKQEEKKDKTQEDEDDDGGDLKKLIAKVIKLSPDKPYYFQLAIKGKEGKLVISRKRLPKSGLNVMVKETKGKPYQGKCYGGDGNVMVMECLKKLPKRNDVKKLIRGLINRDQKIELTLGARELAETEDEKSTGGDPQQELYTERWEELQQDVDRAIKSNASTASRLRPLLDQANMAASGGDYAKANRLLTQIEDVLDDDAEIPETTTTGSTATDDSDDQPPEGKTDAQRKKELNQQFKALQNDLKMLLKVNDDRMPDPTDRVAAYRKSLAAKLWDVAAADLLELTKEIARANKYCTAQRDEIEAGYARWKPNLAKAKAASERDVYTLERIEQYLQKCLDATDFANSRHALANLSRMVTSALDRTGVDEAGAKRISDELAKVWAALQSRYEQAAQIDTFGFWPEPQLLKGDYDSHADAGRWYSAERSMTNLQTLTDKILAWQSKLSQRVTNERKRVGKLVDAARRQNPDSEEGLQSMLQAVDDAIDHAENFMLASQNLVELRGEVTRMLKEANQDKQDRDSGQGDQQELTDEERAKLQEKAKKLEAEVKQRYKDNRPRHMRVRGVTAAVPMPDAESDLKLLEKQMAKGRYREADLILTRWDENLTRLEAYVEQEQQRFEQLIDGIQQDFDRACEAPRSNATMLRAVRNEVQKTVDRLKDPKAVRADLLAAQKNWTTLERLVTSALDQIEPQSAEDAKAAFDQEWNAEAQRKYGMATQIEHPDTWPAPKDLKSEFDSLLSHKKYRSAGKVLKRLNTVVAEILAWYHEAQARLAKQLKVAKANYKQVRNKEIGSANQEKLDDAFHELCDLIQIHNDLVGAEEALAKLRKLTVELDLSAKSVNA